MNKQQRGVTLVELMISMVLSLGLIAGISSLFLQMQKSNALQRGLSAMTDESSYVQEVLNKEIRRTGGLKSRSDGDGSVIDVFLGGTLANNGHVTNTYHNNVLGSGINFAAGEFIKGGSVNSADAFILRYQLLDVNDLGNSGNSNSNSPCTQIAALATTDPASLDPAKQVHVVSVFVYLDGTTLKCTAQRAVRESASSGLNTDEWCSKNCATPRTSSAGVVAADFVAPTSTVVSLISNVVSMQLRYGIDTDQDKAANYYVAASSISDAYTSVTAIPPAGAFWRNVVSVRLSLVVRSENDNLTDTAVAYKIDGEAQTAPTDKRLYRSITTTIALRNQLL